MSTAAALAGSTGLVGSHILTQLLSHPSILAVNAYTRRELPQETASPKLYPLSSTDTSVWPSLFPRSPAPSLFISALGTTRAAAGGVDAQRKIDLDLNYDLAVAAKDAGVQTYVLVSSGGANANSMAAYPKMKGELEEKVKALGFKHTVILRPGLILGTRGESRPAEAVVRHIAWGLKRVTPALTNFWAQDAETIARAAVEAGVRCEEGKREGKEGVWELGQKDILELGEVRK
ncbi:hypothetical protein BU24DRAFT_428509 [Aaosphaeria arxii CBS 175.79]|uniref:Uncharacterized protein n=1 Tax=Aaosphaeria arxii CBS 175.79 TaxID=1450172 RepID=A0A6A5X9I1_9PLEO|nr:uncharacterized protein BU24DRAFT_428509 [Aaosphaeria arxii CBS 175.79]KAF2009611.1 hypothetical protein BU24DRAFT_428509 [Aaosphaeria arxii CBS 175.79]